jgi:hypothetical protein
MDYELPVVAGYEAISGIKANPQLPSIPIIRSPSIRPAGKKSRRGRLAVLYNLARFEMYPSGVMRSEGTIAIRIAAVQNVAVGPNRHFVRRRRSVALGGEADMASRPQIGRS